MKESLMVTFIIDAMEGRDVSIDDITGIFIQVYMVQVNHTVRVRICGVLEDLLVNIDP